MRKHKIGGNQKVKKVFAVNRNLHGKRIYKTKEELMGWGEITRSVNETCIYQKVVYKIIYHK